MASNEPMNFETELKRALSQEPFHTFVVTLTSGDKFEVTQQFQMAISPEGSGGVFFHPKNGLTFFRKNQIVSIEIREPAV